MSNPWIGRIVVTDSGVYQPPLFVLDGVLLTVVVLAITIALALGHVLAASLWPGLVILMAFATVRIIAYFRHGPLGKTSLALRDGVLVFTLSQDSRGQIEFRLAEFQELVIYGAASRRSYRFIRQDRTHAEVVPAWGASVEAAALAFLLRRLPPAVQVSVEEPQTVFASIRGDGP